MEESFNEWWRNFISSTDYYYLDPLFLEEFKPAFYEAFKRGYELSENCNAHRV